MASDYHGGGCLANMSGRQGGDGMKPVNAATALAVGICLAAIAVACQGGDEEEKEQQNNGTPVHGWAGSCPDASSSRSGNLPPRRGAGAFAVGLMLRSYQGSDNG